MSEDIAKLLETLTPDEAATVAERTSDVIKGVIAERKQKELADLKARYDAELTRIVTTVRDANQRIRALSELKARYQGLGLGVF
jgi:hypothetical protein